MTFILPQILRFFTGTRLSISGSLFRLKKIYEIEEQIKPIEIK